jgi:hypothetical protein
MISFQENQDVIEWAAPVLQNIFNNEKAFSEVHFSYCPPIDVLLENYGISLDEQKLQTLIKMQIEDGVRESSLTMSHRYNKVLFDMINSSILGQAGELQDSLFFNAKNISVAEANERFLSRWTVSSEFGGLAYNYGTINLFGGENVKSTAKKIKYVKEMDETIDHVNNFVKHTYDLTQSNLMQDMQKKDPINTTDEKEPMIKLFRGIHSIYATPNPLESWSSKYDKVRDFGTCLIISALVPLRAILISHVNEHFFSPQKEYEYIVIRNLVPNSEVTIESVGEKCLQYKKYKKYKLDKALELEGITSEEN